MSNFGDHQLPVEVVEIILSNLDSFDLLNICLVSKSWRCIAEKLWLGLLEKNVRTLPMWKETYNYLDFPFPFNSNNFSWDEAKMICHKIFFYIQKINKNWKRNTFCTRKICLAGEEDPLQNFTITLGMDYKKIAANYHYLNGNGCIKVWNRASLEKEIVIDTYRYAVCLHLSSNMLFASFPDGKVKIWDAKTGELLNSIKNEIEGVVESMCFINGVLVTLSPESPEGQPCTCLTVQYLSNTAEIMKTNSSLFSGMKSFGLGFDGRWIVFHSNMLQSGDRTFQIRSVESFELINIIAAPEKLSNFQYKNGLLITTHDNILQMWDVKTGVCIRKLREDQSVFISISFNSKFLLTSYVGGIKIWKLSALLDKLTAKKKCLHSKLRIQSLPPAITSLEFDNFQIVGFSIRSRSEITILDFCNPTRNLSNPLKRKLKR